MAVNTKTTELTEETSPAYSDMIDMVKDPAGSPLDRKTTRKNFVKLATAIKTTDHTTTDDDDVLFLNSATSKTLSLILGATRGSGRPYYVKNINAGVWTIDPNGSETINGAATLDVAEGDSLMICWTGSAWESI